MPGNTGKSIHLTSFLFNFHHLGFFMIFYQKKYYNIVKKNSFKKMLNQTFFCFIFQSWVFVKKNQYYFLTSSLF
jgi:hypothetical protein